MKATSKKKATNLQPEYSTVRTKMAVKVKVQRFIAGTHYDTGTFYDAAVEEKLKREAK